MCAIYIKITLINKEKMRGEKGQVYVNISILGRT